MNTLHKTPRWELAAILIVFSALLMGSNYFQTVSVDKIFKYSPTPDYARYHWKGFHRTVSTYHGNPPQTQPTAGS